MESETPDSTVNVVSVQDQEIFSDYPYRHNGDVPAPPRELDYDLLYSEEIDEAGYSGGGSGTAGQSAADDTSGKMFRGKNKRTVAAVSPADRTAALTAMEELRGRGATTEDLVCRLCGPPRPFTAYSTLLTHYRKNGANIVSA